MSVSALLFWLILACLVPEVLGVCASLYYEYQDERIQSDKGLALSVRTMVQTIDAELAQVQLIAQVLTTSGSLRRHDLAAFHRRTVLLIPSTGVEVSAVLFDKSGRQLLNTHIPWGQPLPAHRDLESIRSVFESTHTNPHRPLFRPLDGYAAISTVAPVFSGREVVYALAVGVVPDKFNSFLREYGQATGAVTTIVDGTGTIAARSHDTAQFVGHKVDPEIWVQLQKGPVGAFDFDLKDGTRLHASYGQSVGTGWRVLMMTPRQSLDAPLTHTLTQMAKGATLVLLLSIALAWLVGRRIVNSVKSLKEAAIAFGKGESLPPLKVNLRETEEVARALSRSAFQLTTRTQELLDANASLHERTTELAEAQHLAQIGNWKHDLVSNERFVSVEMQELFGPKVLLPFAELAGTLFTPEVWKQVDHQIRETIRTGVGFSLVGELFDRQGSPIWTDNRCEAVFNGKGEVIGLRGTCQDISKYKAAEILLLDNEARLKMALSSSDLALWDWHIQSGDLFMDERWAAIQGYTLMALPYRMQSYMQSVFPEDMALIYKNLELHYRSETPKYEAIYRVRHRDGHCVWIQATGRVVERDAAGEPLRMLGVALDISARKENEYKMEALHDEMNAMLVWQVAQHTVAALAHEINQPLASLAILCEAATRLQARGRQSDGDHGERLKRSVEPLERMNIEIKRAAAVVRSLLTSVNKPDITRANVVVNELVRESIQKAYGEGIFGYAIVAHDGAHLPLVKVNQLQVSKVLLNLIHNSAQAMQAAQMPNGKIEVSTALSADGSAISITVQDEGPGISALMQQEIFQPFISTKSHGLGLGLTISRALIEAHGGKLWASQTPGQGATFHFTLPITG